MNFGKKINVKHTVKNISSRLEIIQSNMRAAKYNILLHCANDFLDIKRHQEEISSEIVQLGRDLSLLKYNLLHKLSFNELDEALLESEYLRVYQA